MRDYLHTNKYLWTKQTNVNRFKNEQRNSLELEVHYSTPEKKWLSAIDSTAFLVCFVTL